MLVKDNQDLTPLNEGDIKVGENLPWSVYSKEGRLLAKEGTIVDSERRASLLIETGHIYKEIPLTEEQKLQIEEENTVKKIEYSEDTNPFVELDEISHTLQELFDDIKNNKKSKPGGIEKRCYDIAVQIQGLCDFNADMMLGALHLEDNQYPYIVRHPIHVAIIATIIAKHLNIPQKNMLILLSAALTQNVGMNMYQEQLQKQSQPLNEEQMNLIKRHPEDGVKILKSAGLTNALWLQIVKQHHEKIDGSGYPAGLKGKEIRPEARIIGLGDVYAAMITGRYYRVGLTAKESLRTIFAERGNLFDPKLTIIFLNELGIYPPGTFVKLKNGEAAIVIKRTEDPKSPVVSSIGDINGSMFIRPMTRQTLEDDFTVAGALNKEQIKNILPKVNPSILFGIKVKKLG